ncbi:MAG: hypothetical protein R6X19_07880 [Kiritimatiellia bacterium]
MASFKTMGAPDHAPIKTIVMETKAPLICLMHGDRSNSTKQPARAMGVKHAGSCASGVCGTRWANG